MYHDRNLSAVRGRLLGRSAVRDALTFDSAFRIQDAEGNMMGKPLGMRCTTHDGRVVDSTGAFMVGELERLDPELHGPLAEVSWQRDIDLRTDVSIADDVSSFTLSSFFSPGGLGTGNSIGTGKAWAGKDSTQITSVSVDIGKKTFPLRVWAVELGYTIIELASAAKAGRPVDQQKYEALKLKHQMDIDEQVYYGDAANGDTGLINNSLVTNVNNVAAGASGQTYWAQKSPDEILADVNTAITSTWQASAWAVMPRRIGLPPAQYGYISTTKISNAGNQSILKYVLENNLLAEAGGPKLEIVPIKWLIGAGVGGTIGTLGTVDRMLVYTKDKQRVRFPTTMLDRTPVQYDGLWQKSTYYCRIGVVECVYPETVSYWDGI